MRRGRRNAETLTVGDALDFWRVEAFEPDRRLSLVAEMKVPGRAWLQFEVDPISVRPDSQESSIRQTAIFDPAGLGGLIYWYALYPVHRWVFAGMLRAIAARAELQKLAQLTSDFLRNRYVALPCFGSLICTSSIIVADLAAMA